MNPTAPVTVTRRDGSRRRAAPRGAARRAVATAAAVVLALAGALVAAPHEAAAQSAASDYPSRSVRLVVPFPPGGVADLLARPLAEKLSASLGQPVVIDNRGGAAGTIAGAHVASAAADGYTLMFATSNEIAMSPSLYKTLPYEPTQAFAPIGPAAEFPNVLVVGPSLPVASVAELVARAKASPGKITFASSGAGSTNHLSAELFQKVAGLRLVHVPYKGGGPAIADLLGGHVDAMFATLPSATQNIRAGKLKALAVTGSTRSPALPDVPTMREAGVDGVIVTTWNGVLAPAGTPEPIRAKLAAAVRAAVADTDVRARYSAAGAVPMEADAAQFGRIIRDDFTRWSALIRDAGIAIE
ncbi:MAG: Bug family tripartite tricarboxylate transporter substrate binding protein [Lautropia sp.]